MTVFVRMIDGETHTLTDCVDCFILKDLPNVLKVIWNGGSRFYNMACVEYCTAEE